MYTSLKNKLVFSSLSALLVITILTITSYFIVRHSLKEKSNDARMINISGQQSLLSQQIITQALLFREPQKRKDFLLRQQELEEIYELWQHFHIALQQGDTNLGLSGHNSASVEYMFKQMEPHYKTMQRTIKELLVLSVPPDSLHTLLLHPVIEKLQENQTAYLHLIKSITFQFDKEVNQRLEDTKNIEYFLMLFTLSILLLVGLFIFRPTISITLRHVDQIQQSKFKLEELNEDLQKSEEEVRLKNEKIIVSQVAIRQNLEELERMNKNLLLGKQEMEEKNGILQAATEVLDQKNKRIRQNRDQLLEQSKLLEVKNKNITNSLRYARRIQESIIPPADFVTQHFQEAFVLFIPKDIVSGDFYWFDKQGDTEIIIAADCTGHGVPGALMTMIGNSLINEIIHTHGITNPSEILHTLDQKIIETLQQPNTDKKPIHDGMDMAVLTIHQPTRTIQFAAAHNPLYYVKQGEMYQVRGSKFPVGSSQYKSEKKFELHTIQAEEGDVFYIFTDGFQDQFGQRARRKYMTKRFRNYLLLISHLKMTEQRQRLDVEFADWKGNGAQTDDVLVIGIKM